MTRPLPRGLRAPRGPRASRAPVALLAALLLGLSPLLGGCLSLGSDPIEIQHYRLGPLPGESSAEPGAPPAAAAPSDRSLAASSDARTGELPPLRLPPVRGPAYVSDRIVWRRSSHEAGYYEDRRWLERPESVVERAVSHELYEVHEVPLSTLGRAHRLELTLTAFEEVLQPHETWISAQVVLTDATGAALLVRTVEAHHPVQGESGEAIAAAMNATVHELAARIGALVADALRGRPMPGGEVDRGA